MKATNIFTKTGNAYWHFHAIGVGIILTYHLSAMQILITCEHTGQLIQVNDFYDVGGLQEEDFKQICLESYKDAVNQGRTLSIDYMDNPTIVGCIGIDFDLMKN